MTILSNFQTTLKTLIDLYNTTQRQLAKTLDISEYKMSDYCTGKQEPDIKDLIKIANYFEISIESLLGQNNYINGYVSYYNTFKKVFPGLSLTTIQQLIDTREIYIFKTNEYQEVIDIDIIHKKVKLKERTLRFKDYGKKWTTI